MKIVLITRHSSDYGRQVWDAWSQNQDAKIHREVVWRGSNGHPVHNGELEFQLFSRREGAENAGTALFMVTDTKHKEQHEVAIIFDKNLRVTGVRKGDLLGNDFINRVGKQAKELGDILNFDREICRALAYGN